MNVPTVRGGAPLSLGTLVCGMVLLLSSCSLAAAQRVDRPFEDLGRYLDRGDTVFVVSRESGEVQGTVGGLSPSSIVVQVDGDEREFASSELGWLDRVPDPIWDEAWQGAVAGYVGMLGGGYFACRSFGGERGECGTFLTSGVVQRWAVTYAGVFAATGLLRDVSRRERWLVYGTRPGDARRQLRAPTPVSSLGDLWSRVRPGDTIYVRGLAGREVTGRFSHASNAGLTLRVDGQLREIPADDVHRVRRRTGQLGRAMLVGPAVGAVLGALSPPDHGTRRGSAFAGGLLGWAVGALVGPYLPGRTVVYGAGPESAVMLEPLLDRGAGGLAVSVRF